MSLAEARLQEPPRPLAAAGIDGVAFALVLLFIVVAPFPYGGILPGGTLMIELFAFVSAALAFLGRPAGRTLGAGILPIVALSCIALIGLVQLLPLDPATIARLSPVSAKTWADASEIMRLFDRGALQPKISIAPNETKSTIVLTLAYAALFAAGGILIRTHARRRLLLIALFATSVGHILYAAISDSASERVHGAFVNPNHFAGYLEIALAMAFGALWGEVLVNRDRGLGIRDRGDRLEKRLLPMAGRILLWGVIAAGIALTRSRGGILAAAVSTVVLLIMGAIHRPGKERRDRIAVFSALAVLLGFGFVALSTGEGPLLRFLAADPRDVGTDDRFAIWQTSLKAWRLFPLLGSGLGAFREAFRRVQPRELHGLVEQAHNDFLQLLVTGGWIGAALGVVVFLSAAVLLIRAWRAQRHREESGFILGGFGALLMLTLHGIVDFNMSVPAIPATLAVLVGASWAATREESGQ